RVVRAGEGRRGPHREAAAGDRHRTAARGRGPAPRLVAGERGTFLVGWAESSRPTRRPANPAWASKTRPTLQDHHRRVRLVTRHSSLAAEAGHPRQPPRLVAGEPR